MMRNFFMFISTAVIFSCAADNLPKGVLPAEKMESVMWDLIQADQALSLPFQTDTTVSRTLINKKTYHQILLLHKVSEEDFKRSFRFYQQNPLRLKPILDSLRTKQADTVTVNKKAVN